jgi:tRNA pseudouridine38-40 synthase
MSKGPSRRVALWCWYHGGAFAGYQTQPGRRTVQDTLCRALSAAGFSRTPVAAGRTDAGVHARMQVLGLRLVEDFAVQSVAERINAQLPADVGIAAAAVPPDKFHPQFSAAAKEYRYRLAVAEEPAWAPFSWRVDVEPSQVAAVLSRAVGTRDFSAFCDATSRNPTAPRTVLGVELAPISKQVLELRVRGAGFGKYQVRYLVGSAVAVALGRLTPERFLEGLERAAPFARALAPAQGLLLHAVEYAPQWEPFGATDSAPPLLPRAPPFT